jgi:hypothetical protein
MKNRITITVFALMLTGSCGCGRSCRDATGESAFQLGLATDFRTLRLKKEAIPPSVRQEAQDPSIVNPYSGNHFGIDTIGAYDPTERFRFLDAGVFGQYNCDVDFPVKPYLRAELQYPFRASTDEGNYGKGYTYDVVLGSGSDDVRYTYGIRYKYAYFLEPEAGLTYEVDDTFKLSFGVSFQRVKLEYYKGIEAWGKTEYLYKIGSSAHDLINYKLRITKEMKPEPYSFCIEPSYTVGDGIEGYGIALSICVNF